VLYPGHVSSLASDLRAPTKNREPQAIVRIADALFFRENLFIGTCRPETDFPITNKKKRRISHSYGGHLIDLTDRERKCLSKINSALIESRQLDVGTSGNNAIFLLQFDKDEYFANLFGQLKLRIILSGLLDQENYYYSIRFQRGNLINAGGRVFYVIRV